LNDLMQIKNTIGLRFTLVTVAKTTKSLIPPNLPDLEN
jgi:hypothetical protein